MRQKSPTSPESCLSCGRGAPERHRRLWSFGSTLVPRRLEHRQRAGERVKVSTSHALSVRCPERIHGRLGRRETSVVWLGELNPPIASSCTTSASCGRPVLQTFGVRAGSAERWVGGSSGGRTDAVVEGEANHLRSAAGGVCLIWAAPQNVERCTPADGAEGMTCARRGCSTPGIVLPSIAS